MVKKMATPIVPRGLVLSDAQVAARVARRPVHTWTLQVRPYVIQPFLIAPVLPGETMKEFNAAARIVTDPVASSLVGWHAEHYWYYVSHRTIDYHVGGQTLQDMVLTQGASVSALYSTSKVDTYHYSADTTTGDAIDYVAECLDVIVANEFRDEGDLPGNHTLGGMPVASLTGNSWLDSMLPVADWPVGDTIAGGETQDELEKMRLQWEYLRGVGLTELGYEEWLSTYGVRLKSVQTFKPELLRMSREWQYPSNTVNPSTGAPSSAVSWSVTVNAGKDRFFKEPGFIIGLCCFRPKVYRKNQRAAAVQLLNDAFAWMPAILKDDPYTSIKTVDNASGPLSSQSSDYVVDLRDLFVYGDQFTNFNLDTTVAAASKLAVDVPTAAGEKDYVTDSDEINRLFASPSANKVHADGRCDFVILGTQVDHT